MSELQQLEATIHSTIARLSGGASTPTPAPRIGDPASLIDHTLLKPQATEAQVRLLCGEARQHRFAAVCINPVWVALSARLLAGSGVKVCTVVGFPLGADLPEAKAFEAERCIALGAGEIDMVIDIGALADGRHGAVRDDISAVVRASHAGGAIVKVIIENAYLTDAQKIAACLCAADAGADFVKTSTGFGPSGAAPADVALMRTVVGKQIGVKAAGGIRSGDDFLAMVAAGANRIGASASLKIIADLRGAG